MTNKEIVRICFAAIDAKDFGSLKNLMDIKYLFRNSLAPVLVGAEEHIGMNQMMTSSCYDAFTLLM